jgi:integrase
VATIRTRKTSRGKNRYFVEIRLQGHPPVRKTFHYLEAARNWAKRIEGEIQSGHLLPALEAQRHTLADAIDRYLEDHLGSLSSSHGRGNRHSQLKWWRSEIGDLPLAQVTPASISDAKRKLLRKVSGPTANRYLAALSAVLKRASQEWQWLDANPVRRVAREKENRGRLRILSEKEKPRLMDACKGSKVPRLYPLVLSALTTGARQGELLRLKWKDVDLVNRQAVLHETKNRDRRMISFPGPAGDLLVQMSKTPHWSGYVFASRQTRPARPPSFPSKAWQEALEDAEIEDFRFHDLRHTAASYLAMSGATLAELATFLGHRSLAMVKRYSHLTEAHTAAVAQRMADRFLS